MYITRSKGVSVQQGPKQQQLLKLVNPVRLVQGCVIVGAIGALLFSAALEWALQALLVQQNYDFVFLGHLRPRFMPGVDAVKVQPGHPDTDRTSSAQPFAKPNLQVGLQCNSSYNSSDPASSRCPTGDDNNCCSKMCQYFAQKSGQRSDHGFFCIDDNGPYQCKQDQAKCSSDSECCSGGCTPKGKCCIADPNWWDELSDCCTNNGSESINMKTKKTTRECKPLPDSFSSSLP